MNTKSHRIRVIPVFLLFMLLSFASSFPSYARDNNVTLTLDTPAVLESSTSYYTFSFTAPGSSLYMISCTEGLVDLVDGSRVYTGFFSDDVPLFVFCEEGETITFNGKILSSSTTIMVTDIPPILEGQSYDMTYEPFSRLKDGVPTSVVLGLRKFTPTHSGTYEFRRSDIEFPRSVYTYYYTMLLLDSQGKQIASSDSYRLDQDDRDFEDEVLSAELTAGNTYYIAGSYGTPYPSLETYHLTVHSHQWNSGVITQEPTCTEEGTKTYSCTYCGEIERQESIPALGHTGGTATCVQKAECSRCKARYGDLKDHEFGNWKTIEKATVFAPEKQERKCNNCQETETRTVCRKLTSSVILPVDKLVLQKGQSVYSLKVSGLANGDYVKSWKSSNKKIVTVSPRGKNKTTAVITAKSKTGTAKITLKLASKKTKTIKVTVKNSAVKTNKISGLPPKITLSRGEKYILKPVITPVTSQEATTYKSSNDKVVTVNEDGIITGKKSGKVAVTVRSGKKKYTVRVTVSK